MPHRWLIGLVVVLSLGFAAPAQAQLSELWDAGMTPDGRPQFRAFLPRDGRDQTVSVHRCPAGGECGEALALAATDPRWADLSAIAPGDALELRYAKDGTVVFSQRTPAWRGTPQLVSRPSIAGEPTVGARIEATPAAWTDAGWAPGWPGDWRNGSATSFAACETADGRRCDVVELGTSWKVDQRWAGRYLFAWTSLSFWNGWVAQIAAPPYPIGDLGADGVLHARSEPFGPICCAPAPAPGPAKQASPSATIRSRALRRERRLLIGRVTCPTRCAVAIAVTGGNRKPLHRSFTASGPTALTIPVRRGNLAVRVRVDGKLVAAGRTRYAL